MKLKLYKLIFLVAAFWNWSVGITLILLSIFFLPDVAPLFGISIPPSLIFLHGLCVLVIVIGVGFLIVSLRPESNQGLVIMGIIEKYSIFIVFFIYFCIGDTNIFGLLIAIGDLILGIIFSILLFQKKSN
ncbi:MAG: hypothetical protein P8Y70_03460 [Candidatus Lokiarchaeota archaeon]